MIRSLAKSVSIDCIFPLAYVSEKGNSVLNRRGMMTYGWELTLPQAFSLQEGDYDSILSSLLAAAKCLPAWTVLHRQDRYFRKDYTSTSDTDSFLSQASLSYFRGRKYMEHRCFIFVSAAAKDIIRNGATGVKGYNSKRIDVKQENIQDFEAKCEEFASALQGGHISLRPLTRRDWIGSEEDGSVGIVQEYLMLGNASRQVSDLRFFDDSVESSERVAVIYKISDSSQLPNNLFSSITVEELSTSQDQIQISSGGRLGVMLDCDHIINQVIVFPSAESAAKELNDRKKRMTAGYASTDNRINSEEIAYYQDYAYVNSLQTVYNHINIIGIAAKGDEKNVRNLISAAIKRMDINSVECSVQAAALWHSCTPSCAMDINKKFLMTQNIDAAFALTPMETFTRSFPSRDALSPTFSITDRFLHVPISLDTQLLAQNLGLIGNYNSCTFGSSGTGKSFFTNNYLRQLYDKGESVFIIDVGDSYELLTSLIHEESGGKDGLYMQFSQENPLSFDIFASFASWYNADGTVNHTEPEFECFLTFLKTIWKPEGGWSERRSNILSDIVDRFLLSARSRFSQEHRPVFNDFFLFVQDEVAPSIRYISPYSVPRYDETPQAAALRQEKEKTDLSEHAYLYAQVPVTIDVFDVNDMLQSISSYAEGGRFGFLCNNRNVKDLFSSRFVVFEVDKLKDIDKNGTFFPVCILFILNAFDKKMREDKEHFKNLVIEEAWTAISNETMAPYIKYLYKTARKFSASINTVTQEVEDILSSPVIKNTIFQNSDIKFLLDQSKNNRFPELADMLDLTSRERALVRTLNRIPNPYNPHCKDVFIKIGASYSGVFTVEVSPQEAIAFESNKTAKEPILQLARQRGSFIEAVRELTSNQ